MSQPELKLVWVNEALLTSPKTKRERDEQANQAARSASWSAWTPLIAVLGTGFTAIALFGLLWVRLANVENSVSKISGQLEPIFKKYYKEIAAASGITATEVEPVLLTKATRLPFSLPFFRSRPEIIVEGKSPKGVDFRLTYTFQRIGEGMLWFNEDISINGKRPAYNNTVGVPLSTKPVPVAAVRFGNVTLPTFYVAVVDRPAPNVAIVALGTKDEKSKT